MNRSVPESLLICILVLCLALTPISVRGETEDSGKAQQLIEAPGAVLMEKETGTVIYSRDPDTRRSPASITKIMTLILIFDAIREGTLHLEDSITTVSYTHLDVYKRQDLRLRFRQSWIIYMLCGQQM